MALIVHSNIVYSNGEGRSRNSPPTLLLAILPNGWFLAQFPRNILNNGLCTLQTSMFSLLCKSLSSNSFVTHEFVFIPFYFYTLNLHRKNKSIILYVGYLLNIARSHVVCDNWKTRAYINWPKAGNKSIATVNDSESRLDSSRIDCESRAIDNRRNMSICYLLIGASFLSSDLITWLESVKSFVIFYLILFFLIWKVKNL